MYPYDVPEPRVKLVLQARYKKRGETLDWLLLTWTEESVRLQGPGTCKGYMSVDKDEFNRDWLKV